MLHRRTTELGPPIRQAGAESVSSLSASSATVVGQILLENGKFQLPSMIRNTELNL